jgi:hypothetical protein
MATTARERFLTSPHRAEFEKIATSAAFESACDYALLALESEMPSSLADPSKSWDYGCHMIGARRVLAILKELHVAPEPAPALKAKTLNYKTT